MILTIADPNGLVTMMVVDESEKSNDTLRVYLDKRRNEIED